MIMVTSEVQMSQVDIISAALPSFVFFATIPTQRPLTNTHSSLCFCEKVNMTLVTCVFREDREHFVDKETQGIEKEV